ncbi:hypothetical protein BJY52DRAFT_1228554 [Lactarius psammicola]|nr:hypothetical protein BJY52DRAFT_1228554 [Lactarius psammicola]
MHETNESDLTRIVWNQFPELKIQDFLESINDTLRAPVLTESVRPSQEVDWEDEEGVLERICTELMVELGWDVSESQTGYTHFYLHRPLQFHKDNNFPATVETFNLSTALGDLEQAGVTPSSWFRLASAVLGAIAWGALWSEGHKIQGRVALSPDDGDKWQVAEGVQAPVTQGGRLAAQAQQIAQFFSHYAGTDKPPLAEFYNSVIRIGQNHIEKVVCLKVAATYQITTVDVQSLTDMVLDNMSKQLYTHMITDNDACKRANRISLDRLFAEAHQQLEPFMNKWKMLYKHSLIQALKQNEEDREDTPPLMDPLLAENIGYIKLYAFNTVWDIRDSIVREVTDLVLDGDEISRARERIRIEHDKEIEAAHREVRAKISSEKKAWAITFCDSNKLAWLTKAAEEMGFVLVSKDDAKEHEGWMAKRHTGPFGKCDRSGSQAEHATPSSVPATPENRPRKLDNSQTPKARKTKDKRTLANPRPLRSRSTSLSSQPSDLSDVPDINMAEIKHPLFFASSYPETAAVLQAVVDHTLEASMCSTGISIPQGVRPSQALDAPLRNPKAILLEPETDVSVHAASRQPSLAPEADHLPDPFPPL